MEGSSPCFQLPDVPIDGKAFGVPIGFDPEIRSLNARRNRRPGLMKVLSSLAVAHKSGTCVCFFFGCGSKEWNMFLLFLAVAHKSGTCFCFFGCGSQEWSEVFLGCVGWKQRPTPALKKMSHTHVSFSSTTKSPSAGFYFLTTPLNPGVVDFPKSKTPGFKCTLG